MIYVIATIRIRPDALEAYATLAQPCIAATRREAGCLLYDLDASTTDPETLVFVQKWESREALADHLNAPHVVAFREAIKPYVIEAQVEIVHPDRVEVM
ncbi:putative quinol monooxygenase [Devosia nitrariae]|uniref:Antibiotic biosynthesis monooxygenase n=1 Tax=Devosia nitrariae TaxID=2071872 RepID=A0ABQ5W0K0_9HYPH|nr:putative quinol monooxygenase [Devosia nitrariae]GLQ53533.1 antibiotic biosynthesis monooxygenase [Devosia nitrariae]